MPTLFRYISKDRLKYHHLTIFSGRYVYQDEKADTEYNRICSKQLDITLINLAKKFLSMMVSGYGCVFSALYASFVQDNKTTSTSVMIPLIEEKSDREFYINLTFQSVFVLHVFLLYCTIECQMNLYEDFAGVAPKLIHLELSECLAAPEKLPPQQLCCAFRNCTILVVDYEE